MEHAYDPSLNLNASYPVCARRCLSLRANSAQFPISLPPEQGLSPDLAFVSVLDACCAASQEMQQEQYQAHNQGHVNESGGYVKCEKSKQPENKQNCGDYPKHVFISLLLCPKTSAISCSRTVLMPLRVRENTAQGAH
jgi:hypothetical protein